MPLQSLPVQTAFRSQLLIGLVASAWLYLFLVLVGPYDTAQLSVAWRAGAMLGYGLLFLVVYLLVIPVQNAYYRHFRRWTILQEGALMVLFFALCLPPTRGYYLGEIINGDYPFGKFFGEIYVPTFIVLLPVLLLSRYLLAKKNAPPGTATAAEQVVLTGDNKLDVLQLPLADLIAVTAANNYVTVYYQLQGVVKKKLLRTTLKDISLACPALIQIHRSHLLNPAHFIAWKDTYTLLVTGLELPVSRTFKPAVALGVSQRLHRL
jgi:hypothetical protein